MHTPGINPFQELFDEVYPWVLGLDEERLVWLDARLRDRARRPDAPSLTVVGPGAPLDVFPDGVLARARTWDRVEVAIVRSWVRYARMRRPARARASSG